MRSLPVPDPGAPDHRSPARYLLWVARAQKATIAGGVLFGVLWMVSQALMPTVIGRAIDSGVAAGDAAALALWSGVLLGLGAVQAAAGVMRHRFATVNWLGAAFRTIQVTSRHAVRLGATLPKRLATGEVVSVGIADVSHIGGAMDIMGRGSGSVAAIAVVGALMLSTSWRLGLIVLAGVPLLAAVVGPLLRPLHRHQRQQRDLQGRLATRAGDIVAGLRVLRGIGGEQVFSRRYREESQAVRAAGVRVARTESLLDGAQLLLPGLLVALVTWAGARLALAGELTVGELVSFYGYAVFLIDPLRTLTEAADKLTKAHVAARRVVRVLDMRPELSDTGTAEPAHGDLVDADSGLVVRPGRFTAVAAATPEDAQDIADRLGRFSDGDVTWGGVPLRDIPLRAVRAAILVADNEARIFSGCLLDELSGAGRDDAAPGRRSEATRGPDGAAPRRDESAGPQAHAARDRTDRCADTARGAYDRAGRDTACDGTDGAVERRAYENPDGDVERRVRAALRAACAEDVVAELPEGPRTELTEGGREFSGGQQQRLRLARALVADPEVLILVEPTSAVDAHTEARIAERLAAFRTGRTTVVCTLSPLVLDRVDEVAFVENGKVTAVGTHRDLLATEPRYAATVTREEQP